MNMMVPSWWNIYFLVQSRCIRSLFIVQNHKETYHSRLWISITNVLEQGAGRPRVSSMQPSLYIWSDLDSFLDFTTPCFTLSHNLAPCRPRLISHYFLCLILFKVHSIVTLSSYAFHSRQYMIYHAFSRTYVESTSSDLQSSRLNIPL